MGRAAAGTTGSWESPAPPAPAPGSQCALMAPPRRPGQKALQAPSAWEEARAGPQEAASPPLFSRGARRGCRGRISPSGSPFLLRGRLSRRGSPGCGSGAGVHPMALRPLQPPRQLCPQSGPGPHAPAHPGFLEGRRQGAPSGTRTLLHAQVTCCKQRSLFEAWCLFPRERLRPEGKGKPRPLPPCPRGPLQPQVGRVRPGPAGLCLPRPAGVPRGFGALDRLREAALQRRRAVGGHPARPEKVLPRVAGGEASCSSVSRRCLAMARQRCRACVPGRRASSCAFSPGSRGPGLCRFSLLL